MKSLHNKWLVVLDSVRLTETIDPVITALEPYFEKAKLKAFVTSGLRTSKDQLRIVQKYLTRQGLDKTYDECANCTDVHSRNTKWDGVWVYDWQPGWSALLNAGVIINPPLPAECLMDYIRDGKNKKGQVIGGSPHFNGTAFDIGGGGDGIENEMAVVKQAIADKVKGLKGHLPERNNNCVHIDCQPIT